MLTNRKRLKYLEFVKQMMEKYKQVRFVNLSISALSFCDATSSDFIDMMKDQQIDIAQTSFVIRKIRNIANRASYNSLLSQ